MCVCVCACIYLINTVRFALTGPGRVLSFVAIWAEGQGLGSFPSLQCPHWARIGILGSI